MMNFGLRKATRHRIAETVRMKRHREGKKSPIMPDIQSEMTLTMIVQFPLTLIGIMNRKTPTRDGTMNFAMLRLCSIIDFPLLIES